MRFKSLSAFRKDLGKREFFVTFRGVKSDDFLNVIKNSKYFTAIKSYSQPDKPIKSTFMLCAVQSSKV